MSAVPRPDPVATPRGLPHEYVGPRPEPSTTAACHPDRGQSADTGSAGRFYGFPDNRLDRAWTIADLCEFLQVSERKARALMRSDGAPATLRLGTERCDRWNPYQVIAWLHGAPNPTDSAPEADPPAPVPAPSAPGRQWSPKPPAATRHTQAPGRPL